MRVNDESTNVLTLEDDRIFDNPVLYVSEPGYWRISDKGAVNDDPNGRMLALANHNCDIAEYWEWSADERFPVDVTSGAYELGVNYIIYAMTH